MAALQPPTDFRITSQTTTSITLSWENNDDYTSLQLFYGIYTFGDFPFNGPSLLATTTTATISGLTPNTQYQFKLLAAKNVELPQVLSPTLVLLYATDTQIFFVVTADPRAVSTQTEISRSPHFKNPFVITGDGSLFASALTPYTYYYIRSRSLGDDVDYESSNWTSKQTIRTTVTLSNPSIKNLISTATTVSFNSTSVPYAAGYQVEVSLFADFNVFLYTSSSSGPHVITGLTDGATVYIRAKAVSGDHHLDSSWTVTSTVCSDGTVLRFHIPIAFQS